MTLTLPVPGVEAVLLSLVLGAAVYDIRYRRIPNWLTVGGVLVGVALNTFLGIDSPSRWVGLRFSLVGMAVGFGVYFVLYLLRAMGAGDVKLMAAVGSMVGWEDWFGVFIFTAIIGGLMALIVIVLRKRTKTTFFNVGFIVNEMSRGRPAYLAKEELDVKNPKSFGLPHGAIIAVGTLFFLAMSAHFTK